MFTLFGVIIIAIIAVSVLLLVWMMRPKRFTAKVESRFISSSIDIDADRPG